MLARERQKEFVNRAIACLSKHSSTLGIASTGAGKTICLSFVIKHYLEKNHNFKVLVLAHRDELTEQNNHKFQLVSPRTNTSIVNAERKDWSGQVVFAMVQTLSRGSNIDEMPKIDLLVIDEAHHATSSSYQTIINRIKELNNNVLIFGVTATPVRSDKALLRKVFASVCDTIKLGELIESGHLVPPKTHVIDVGISDEMLKLRSRIGEYDMDKVEQLMNSTVINNNIVNIWLDKSRDRKTVIFCSTIAHAKDVTECFLKSGVKAALITGELSKQERSEIFKKLDNNQIQVIVNVAVLTEGWDYQPISCVVLLRPCSFKGAMIQMIGRGLRTVDYTLYPNVQKTDCLVIDFGTSIITHGSLEQDINFAPSGFVGDKEKKEKKCPECDAAVPYGVYECDLCGYVFEQKEKKEKDEIDNVKIKEIDLFAKSNFEWVSLNNNKTLIATGFYASVIISKKDNIYIAAGMKGKGEEKKVEIIYKGDKLHALSVGNDFINQYETDDSCYSSKKWKKLLATDAQREWLPEKYKDDLNLNRYMATCLLKLKFNKKDLKIIGVI